VFLGTCRILGGSRRGYIVILEGKKVMGCSGLACKPYKVVEFFTGLPALGGEYWLLRRDLAILLQQK
jgi:hypothetical protein